MKCAPTTAQGHGLYRLPLSSDHRAVMNDLRNFAQTMQAVAERAGLYPTRTVCVVAKDAAVSLAPLNGYWHAFADLLFAGKNLPGWPS